VNILHAALLGALQGLTEFLPVSSSGHLVIAEALLDPGKAGAWRGGGITFEVAVHVGTLVAVVFYFRRRLLDMVLAVFDSSRKAERRMIWYLIVGTAPAVVVGLFLSSIIDEAFHSPREAAVELMISGAILLALKWAPERLRPLSAMRALIIGIAQAVAILPGISRSGSTIAAGLYLGVSRAEVAEYSFLLSVPAIMGAAILEIPNLSQIDTTLAQASIVGACVAGIVGFLTIGWLMRLIRQGQLLWFGVYCFVAGAAFLLFL